MVASRKFLVIDSSRRQNIRMPRKWVDSLPFVEGMPGEDDQPGLLELADGGLRRVLKVAGHNLSLLETEHEQFAATFEKVLDCLDSGSELQFLAISLQVDADAFMDEYLEISTKEHPYLEWYADYTNKWFRRVCEVSIVPRRDFYIVLSERRGEKDGTDTSSKQLERLDRRIADISAVLEHNKLKVELLTRSEVRRLIYSSMRISYPTGLMTEPVETLTKSSLPRVGGTGTSGHIVVDSQFIANQVISDLPSKAKLGWLMQLISHQFPSTLSIHVRRRDLTLPAVMKTRLKNLLKNSESLSANELYEFSFYSSTFSPCEKTMNYQRAALKDSFKKQGALLSPDQDQFSAWISTLPLGIDSGGIALCITKEDARLCWPFFTESCGSVTGGFPLGFARTSREPVFLRPTEMKNVYALASNKDDLVFFHSIMTIRLLSSDHHVLYIDEGSNEMSMLVEVLGPDYTNDWRTFFDRTKKKEGAEQKQVLDLPQLEEAALTMMRYGKTHSATTLNRFKQTIAAWQQRYCQKKNLAIFISDVNQMEGKFGIESLQFIFDFANRMNVTVVTGALTSSSIDLSAVVNDHARTRVVMPIDSAEHALAGKLLSLNSGELQIVDAFSQDQRDLRQISCLLLTEENRGVVKVTPSPMDFWLCAPHSTAIDERIKKMKVELKAKNPKLSKTDVARQAVYYLGLNEPN